MSRAFDIAVVGCGGVSSMHFEGCARHSECARVVAACDLDAARAQAAAQKWDIPAVFSTVDAVIEGARWEVAVVCTPTPVREAVVNTLAAAGKHLFVEKPLADSYDEAWRMVAACQAAGVRLAVDQNFRYHYPFQTARELIAAGRVGKVLGITHHDLFFRQDRGWRVRHPRHALAVMGIHWLDGFRWMLSEEARSLCCRTHRSAAIDCSGETEAFVQIAFETGASASYVQSFSSPLARTETLIFGAEGLLSLNYQGAALFKREAGREPVEQWPNPFAGANKPESAFAGLHHLLMALETGEEPPNSGRDNLKTVALLDAAYRSAAEQRPVSFEGGLPV
jgi:predicted dehydrogenase